MAIDGLIILDHLGYVLLVELGNRCAHRFFYFILLAQPPHHPVGIQVVVCGVPTAPHRRRQQRPRKVTTS